MFESFIEKHDSVIGEKLENILKIRDDELIEKLKPHEHDILFENMEIKFKEHNDVLIENLKSFMQEYNENIDIKLQKHNDENFKNLETKLQEDIIKKIESISQNQASSELNSNNIIVDTIIKYNNSNNEMITNQLDEFKKTMILEINTLATSLNINDIKNVDLKHTNEILIKLDELSNMNNNIIKTFNSKFTIMNDKIDKQLNVESDLLKYNNEMDISIETKQHLYEKQLTSIINEGSQKMVENLNNKIEYVITKTFNRIDDRLKQLEISMSNIDFNQIISHFQGLTKHISDIYERLNQLFDIKNFNQLNETLKIMNDNQHKNFERINSSFQLMNKNVGGLYDGVNQLSKTFDKKIDQVNLTTQTMNKNLEALYQLNESTQKRLDQLKQPSLVDRSHSSGNQTQNFSSIPSSPSNSSLQHMVNPSSTNANFKPFIPPPYQTNKLPGK